MSLGNEAQKENNGGKPSTKADSSNCAGCWLPCLQEIPICLLDCVCSIVCNCLLMVRLRLWRVAKKEFGFQVAVLKSSLLFAAWVSPCGKCSAGLVVQMGEKRCSDVILSTSV